MFDMLASNPQAALAALSAGLPFAAFALIILVTRGYPRVSAASSIAAIGAAFVCAASLFVLSRAMTAPLVFSFRWVAAGELAIPFGLLLDPLSLLMLLIVTGISLLVQVYSLGYMAGDPGFSRYFAFMSLFAWAMISLTMASTLLQLYIFWELVGVASYLLIGFWFEKFSASEAGKKAFVMTRLGDVAFLLGLLTLLAGLGHLEIVKINEPVTARQLPGGVITLGALLIFGGIVGKSAQFPLLTWLPDAMEGPTPVSALLHSATMVAAGVYLFARIFPFFSLSPTAMTVFLAIGTVSMLLAATMAMVARDIKQVWAYSTISQLGFMIMGLASGGYVAGVFHLTTHAGFKALLFLCAGVFIHTYHTNDMFEIGRRGGRRLKIPMVCLIIGAAALSGLPPFSGFFSKEAIMGSLAGLPTSGWLAVAILGAFLTAYYTFRLVFIMLFPRDTATPGTDTVHSAEADSPGHYGVMAVPLILLAVVTLSLGWFHGALASYLAGPATGAGEHAGGAALLVTALGCAGGGVFLAWFEFGRKRAPQIGMAERIPAVRNLFQERWYLDRCYRWALDHLIYKGLARICALNDQRVIDPVIDGLGNSAVGSGRRLADWHQGMLQFKLLVIFAVLVFLGLNYFL